MPTAVGFAALIEGRLPLFQSVPGNATRYHRIGAEWTTDGDRTEEMRIREVSHVSIDGVAHSPRLSLSLSRREEETPSSLRNLSATTCGDARQFSSCIGCVRVRTPACILLPRHRPPMQGPCRS